MTSAGWSPTLPYNEIPRLAALQGLETVPVLRACIEARARLAELNRASLQIPNPALLINTLPMLESQASSEIENIVTTADVLFRSSASSEERADPATREALRYRRALHEGSRDLEQRPLTTRTAELVCSCIKGAEMTVRRVPGTRIVEQATGETVYTPPEGEALLRELLADWERFIHAEDELDPLIRLAVAHYQFEAIHPFTDGNGRTGRVLNSLYLVERKLLTMPILYLSRFIIRNKPAYYRGLRAVTSEQAWEAWILYMLQAVAETSGWTTAKIGAIRDLAQATHDYVRSVSPKIYSHELVETLFVQPYCRIANIVEAGVAGRQTAARYLGELVRAGVLARERVGREVLFTQPRLMRLLTEDTNTFAPFTPLPPRP